MATHTHPETTSEAPLPGGSRTHGRLSAAAQIDLLLLRTVDTGLAAFIFMVPLILGGRAALGHFVIVLLAILVAGCWCLRQCLTKRAAWIRSPIEFLLLAALILVGLQLVPLSPSLLNTISPRLYETLPLWASDSGSPESRVWSTLSLTPIATREAFVMLLAFALLMLVVVQRVRQIEDVERFLRWIAIATLGMAAFGLVQYVTSNGKFFWFFEHPFAKTNTSINGSFTNRNHFAQFLALGIGPLIWWLHTGLGGSVIGSSPKRLRFGQNFSRRDTIVGLRTLALGFCIFVALMSLSRGGALAMFAAALVCMLILYRGSLIGRKTLLTISGTALFVGTCLCIYGYEPLTARLDDFGSLGTLDRNEGRRELWKADAGIIADYPVMGTGLSSHCEVNPMYYQSAATGAGIEFTHAENGYVQVAMETGTPGLLLVLTGIGLCAYWCLSTLRRGPSTRVFLCFGAIAASLSASFVHSLSDFVWYVPGCMIAPIVLAACALRLWQLERDRSRNAAKPFWVSRTGWFAAAMCVVLLGGFMVQDKLGAVRAEPSWHRYLILSQQHSNADAENRHEALNSMMRELAAVVRWQPDHARAHIRLAAGHLELFDRPQDPGMNPLGVKQVRDAILAKPFEKAEDLNQWLSNAFPNRHKHLNAALHHTRRALALCPLLGEGYLFLADLSFLEGPNSPGKAAYVEQALKVRPFDGAVLFATGQEAMLAGDIDRAFTFWRTSFRLGRDHQRRLLKVLAGRLPIDFLLETFEPDYSALEEMKTHYFKNKLSDDLRIIRQRYVEVAERRAHTLQGSQAAEAWLHTAATYRRLQNVPEQVRCLRSAVRCDFSCYRARYALGECLFELGELNEAEKHLIWCSRQEAKTAKLRQLLENIVDQRLRLSDRPAVGQRSGNQRK